MNGEKNKIDWSRHGVGVAYSSVLQAGMHDGMMGTLCIHPRHRVDIEFIRYLSLPKNLATEDP